MKLQNRAEMGYFEKVKSLSALMRVILMFVSAFVVAFGIVAARMIDNFAVKTALSFLCIIVGYAGWVLLLSFFLKRIYKGVEIFVLIIIPLAMLVNVWGEDSFVDHKYISDMKLLSSITAPCGDYSAEAYEVSANEDGSFHGKVYLAYLPTGKKSMYKNTRKALYENEHVEKLELQWEDDSTLLVNGERIDVYP